MSTRLLTDWLAALESEFDLDPNDIAKIVRVPPRTVIRWRRGEAYPQNDARQRLDVLYDLQQEIHRFIGIGRAAQQWLRKPSLYLGHETPLTVLREGEIEEVREVLSAAQHGFSI